jgi:hypothetical protein
MTEKEMAIDRVRKFLYEFERGYINKDKIMAFSGAGWHHPLLVSDLKLIIGD